MTYIARIGCQRDGGGTIGLFPRRPRFVVRPCTCAPGALTYEAEDEDGVCIIAQADWLAANGIEPPPAGTSARLKMTTEPHK